MGKRWLYWPDASGGGGGGGGGGGSDPLFNNVILLLPLDGEDDDVGAPFKTDFSPKAQTTSIESLAKADLTAKFGTTSLWGLTTNNDSLRCNENPTEFTLRAKSFCFEMWVRWATTANRDFGNSEIWRRRTFITTMINGTKPLFSFAYRPYVGGEALIFEWTTDDDVLRTLTAPTVVSDLLPTPGPMAVGHWHHVCVERGDDNILRLFQDGVVRGSTNITGQTFKTDDNKECWIGQQNNSASSFMNGWIDEVRCTLDVERYGGSFTPPGKLPLS